MGAFGEAGAGDAGSDAGSAAGDDDELVLKAEIHGVLFRVSAG